MIRLFLNRVLFLLILSINVGPSSAQSIHKKYRFLTYGLPDEEKRNAQKNIATKWNIEYYSVAGCIIDEVLEDSVSKLNKVTDSLLVIKYGVNWKERFDKEVDVELLIEKEITELIDSKEFIKRKNLTRPVPGRGYTMFPVKNSSKYIVYIDSYEKWKGKFELLIYYKLLVDYKNRTVKILSDTIVKQ